MGIFGNKPPPPPPPTLMEQLSTLAETALADATDWWSTAEPTVQLGVAVAAVAVAYLLLKRAGGASASAIEAKCELGPAGKPRGSVAAKAAPTPLHRLSTGAGPKSPERSGSAKQFIPEIASAVYGTVRLVQAGGKTTLEYTVSGLKPGAHALHVHESADFSSGCRTAGAIFAPIGEIQADNAGTAKGKLETALKLSGARSVVGRSIIVHAGGVDDSKTDSRSRPAGGEVKLVM
jgi:Cu/Zn superoxide dismutase